MDKQSCNTGTWRLVAQRGGKFRDNYPHSYTRLAVLLLRYTKTAVQPKHELQSKPQHILTPTCRDLSHAS